MTTLDLALDFHRRGLNVVSVPRPGGRHDGKVPIVSWKRWQTDRQTEADVVALVGDRESNLAIITGHVSGVVVVDVDRDDALTWVHARLPYTPWQTRTGKGWHLFYQHPGVMVRNRARLDTGDGTLAVDVRGDKGYVIAPGSLHASGARYTFAGDWTHPPARLPRFWPGWIAKAERPRPSSPLTPRPTGDLVERARRYLAAIPRPEIGQGSDAAVLSAACRLVRGFALDELEAVALLDEWAGGRPGWDREWIAAKVRNAAKYGDEPIGAYR